MKNKYTIKELSLILGCSVTAVSKKIKPSEDNPDVKLYRNEFETIVENNVTYILLSDEDLELEKSRSKGFNKNSAVEYVHATVEQTTTFDERLLNFTEQYIKNLEDLQHKHFEELEEKNRQLFLLTSNEQQKEKEYLETNALNKTLLQRFEYMKYALTIVSTLLLVFIVLYIVAAVK